MSYIPDGYVMWPVPPDWADGVRETLGWLSDVITARTGAAQKRELRINPRREFTFDIIADDQARRVADMLLQDHGSKYWLLPIWHDVQWIDPVPAETDIIPCSTEGFELLPESLVVIWLSVREWQVAMIESVAADHIVLALPTTRAWPAGTRLYPVRTAHLVEQPEEAAWTDTAGRRSVTMMLDEPSTWPAVLPEAAYRGYPVLEQRPETSDETSSTFARMVETLDEETGVIVMFDRPGRSFREVSINWILEGRTEHSQMRSLLYALRGRMQNLWIPTWSHDLLLVAPVTAVATTLTIEWAGYTLFGRAQPNRRDIRIELLDGTVLYRRITGSAEGIETEQLTIDAALGQPIAPADVLLISFLVISEQASDRVELQHSTDADGITLVSTQFRGIRDDG